MKIALVLVLGALLILGTTSFHTIEKVLPIDTDHPNQCYDNETSEVHDRGSSWFEPGRCARFACKKVEGEYHIISYGCGDADPVEGCALQADETLEYPKCCPVMVC
ncbi:uncharacterized protein [Anabrus simplex]|uniref:uncharacterized protein n=1 Tax=Anabrus simplex TaxID=316456 RepID=UPI0034DDC611